MTAQCLFAACLILFAAPSYAAMDTIVPLPKEIRAVGDPIPLEGFHIVAANDEKSQIGAAAINQRIVSLGGKALPVGRLDGQLPTNRSIVIAPSVAEQLAAVTPSLDVTPTNPGSQGYVIQPNGGERNFKLLLVGSDELGTLYAAITCQQLILKKDGRLLLQPAAVRDWPDYKTRCNGTSLRGKWHAIRSAEARGDLAKARQLAARWVESEERRYDWMLRAKINMVTDRSGILSGDAREETTVARDALKQIHEYGWKRGIEAIVFDTTSIGHFPEDKDNPDFNKCVLTKSNGRYYCWSRLDYHQRRAERAAKWLADCGYRAYYIHATDSGSWANPALWDDRCDECRKNYGDDHAKADAAVFGIYYRAIKQRIPDARIIAVVYPYTGRYLDSEYVYRDAASTMGQGGDAHRLAEQTKKKLTAFLQRLDLLLPPDLGICIRESEPRYVDLARQAWGRRTFYLYFEYAYWKGWRPYFLTTPLMTRSLYYPDYNDILYGNASGRGPRELTQLLGVECAWNVNRPKAMDFDSASWHDWGAVGDVPPERQAFAMRACRFWFGDDAGPLIAPAFAENISHEYICFPEEVLDHVKLDDPVRTMREQEQAAGRAAASLDKLWKLQQQSPVLSGDEYGYFLNLYQMTHAARILAGHRAAMMAARQAIQQGDRTEAHRQFAAARTLLDRETPAWAALNKKFSMNQRLISPHGKATTDGLLSTLDTEELRKETDDLAARCDELIAAQMLPGWFERSCRKRELVAVKVGEPIVVDGRLNEAIWSNAPRIEHFVDWRKLRLESLETAGRLAYDDAKLYVAMECFDPDPSDIATAMRGPDQESPCDSVEVLVAPQFGSGKIAHWIVDSHGTVYDARTMKADDGRIQHTEKWNGTAQVKVLRGSDRWTVEMAIPREDLGLRLKPGGLARILLCRNIIHSLPKGEQEQNAVLFLDGSKFQTVEKYARLRFANDKTVFPEPQVDVALRDVAFGHETIGDGSGTYFGGDFSLETDCNLHDVRITAEYSDGIQPLGKAELGTAPLVQLRWTPKQPLRIHVPIEVPGVVCSFVVSSREGKQSFKRRFGNPRRSKTPSDQLFAPGILGRALAVPAHFSSLTPPKLNVEEGTIEFWIRPSWNVVPRSVGPRGSLEHALLNIGPVRSDALSLSNRSSLTISHRAPGYLYAILSNNEYQARTVNAGIRDWQAGQWHHVALQWKLDNGGKTAMALYLDGRLASDRRRGSAKDPNDRPLKMKPLPFPVQIGSMNTGFRPADALIDELRISSVRRYHSRYVPQEKPFTPDTSTLALFHFDGSLNAETPIGCRLVPGPVQ